MTRVLVTDARRGSAMAVIRSLGRRGIGVVGADSDASSPGFKSKYVTARVVYPLPDAGAEATVAALREGAAAHEVDLVIPVGEDVVVMLSNARDEFAGIVPVALPDQASLEVARNKMETVELAARLDVPAPRTELAHDADDALAHVGGFRWPIVLKPQRSRAVRADGEIVAFGVRYAGDRRELTEEMRAFEGRCNVLLQEYCEGEGHGVGLLLDHGRPLAAFQHRRIREVPFTGGPSSFRESVPLDPALFDYSVRLLAALDWTGPAMVEFKLGRDGPRLMEINGRLWGSLPLAVKSGVDFPGKLVDLYLSPSGEGCDPALTYGLGVRSRDVALELAWIGSVLGRRRPYTFLPSPRRREAVRAALRLVNPRDGFDVLSLGDPLPGLAGMARMATKVVRRLVVSAMPFGGPAAGKSSS
jgi:predicted ATP-grasp superfamily ATP-dependent carboligase